MINPMACLCKEGYSVASIATSHGGREVETRYRSVYLVPIMTQLNQNLIAELLDAAKAAGADGADAGVSRSEGVPFPSGSARSKPANAPRK